MRDLRSKLSYANVMATIAVFIALGGSAYAATQLKKNSVGTKQLKKNSVNSSKVRNHSLTGTDIRLNQLGTVPSATHSTTADSANALSPLEAIHVVGAQGQPSFEGGSSNYFPGSANFPPVSFYKDHDGIVHLEGYARVGKSSAEKVVSIFALPPGFRPANGITLVFENGEGMLVFGTNANFGMSVFSGNVEAEQNQIQNLNGIAFRAGS